MNVDINDILTNLSYFFQLLVVLALLEGCQTFLLQRVVSLSSIARLKDSQCLRLNGMDFVLYIINPLLHKLFIEHDIFFLCPQRNFGRHIVIALSVRPSVSSSVSQSVRPSVPLSCPVHISYIL